MGLWTTSLSRLAHFCSPSRILGLDEEEGLLFKWWLHTWFDIKWSFLERIHWIRIKEKQPAGPILEDYSVYHENLALPRKDWEVMILGMAIFLLVPIKDLG